MANAAASYDERLARFKENEKPEAVLLVADDPELVKVIVAWSNTVAKSAEPISALAEDTEDHVWKWLWDNTLYSRAELLSRIALHEREFERKWRILAGNRIVYPDGTVNSFVQRYLREKVLNLFDSKPRGAGRGRP
jgi:hypothetical protein